MITVASCMSIFAIGLDAAILRTSEKRANGIVSVLDENVNTTSTAPIGSEAPAATNGTTWIGGNSSATTEPTAQSATQQISSKPTEPEHWWGHAKDLAENELKKLKDTAEKVEHELTSVACAAGSVSSDGKTCVPCVGGQQPNSAQTQCVPCAAGSASSDGKTCVPCVAGSVSSDGKTCVACTPGFAPNADQTKCVGCALGSASSDGKKCVACNPGHAPNANQIQCVSCEAGYVSSDGKTCVACTAGFAPDAGHSYCVACSAGSVSSDGQTCVTCTGGKQPSSDKTKCVCPTGFVSNSDKTKCVCPTGYKGVQCNSCADGYVQESESGKPLQCTHSKKKVPCSSEMDWNHFSSTSRMNRLNGAFERCGFTPNNNGGTFQADGPLQETTFQNRIKGLNGNGGAGFSSSSILFIQVSATPEVVAGCCSHAYLVGINPQCLTKENLRANACGSSSQPCTSVCETISSGCATSSGGTDLCTCNAYKVMLGVDDHGWAVNMGGAYVEINLDESGDTSKDSCTFHSK